MNYLTSVGQKPNTGFTRLTSGFLQPVFLSEGSALLLAHSDCWQNSVPCGWRATGYNFLQLSDKGHSPAPEATHVPWLVALLPHLQSWRWWGVPLSLLLSPPPPSLSLPLLPPSSDFKENLSFFMSLMLITSANPFVMEGDIITGSRRP